jgi:hypothetical protein
MRPIVAILGRLPEDSERRTWLLTRLTHKFSKSLAVVSNETSFIAFATAKWLRQCGI